MSDRAVRGDQWAVRIVALVPVLLVTLGLQDALGARETVVFLVPAAALTGVLTALVGRWPGLVAVLASGVVGLVVPSDIDPITLGLSATLVAGVSWGAQCLVASRRPATAIIPPVVLLALVLLVGLSGTSGSVLLAVGVTVSLALVLLTTGSWTGGGDGPAAAVSPAAGAVAWSALAMVLIGVASLVAGLLADEVMPTRPASIQVQQQTAQRPPVVLDVGDPLTLAARWQLDPAEANRSLVTLLPPVRAVRLVWLSMDQYDGVGWVIPRSFRSAPGSIDAEPDLLVAGSLTGSARVEVGTGLPGPFVPVPQRVTQVVGTTPVRVGPSSGTVLSIGSPIGQHFDVRYRVGVATDAQLASAMPAAIAAEAALALPAPLPKSMAALADSVAADSPAGSAATWSRLVTLSSRLRSRGFRAAPASQLSLQGPGGRLADLDSVLVERVGFQSQYASIFALTARSWGIPTRLCVGFLPLIRRAGTLVRGPDTSVWAEARLAGIGWVAFQASPQDRDAGRPSVVRPPRPPEASTTPLPAPTPTSGSVPTPAATAQGSDRADVVAASGGGEVVTIMAEALAIVLLLAAWPAALWARRRRARARLAAGSPQQRVAGAWLWARLSLRGAGLARPPDVSPDRIADPEDTAVDDLPADVAVALRELAGICAPALYAPEEVGQATSDLAWAAAAEVERACLGSLAPVARICRWLVPAAADLGWEHRPAAGSLSETVSERALRHS